MLECTRGGAGVRGVGGGGDVVWRCREEGRLREGKKREDGGISGGEEERDRRLR